MKLKKLGQITAALLIRIRRRGLGFAFALVAATQAFAQQPDPMVMSQLAEEAVANGFVPVLVSLKSPDLLGLSPEARQAARSNLASQEKQILQTLGTNATLAWSNGLGQFGLHVLPQGLAQLQNDARVSRVIRDVPRVNVHDADNHFPKIREEIARTGRATVRVVPNLENLIWQLGRNGDHAISWSQSVADEYRQKVPALLNRWERGILNLPAAQSAVAQGLARKPDGGATPEIELVVNQQGFLLLQASTEIRSMRSPTLDATRPPADVSSRAKALEEAQRAGFAKVMIILRTPAGYSPMTANMSKPAAAAFEKSFRDAIVEIVEALDPAAVRTIQPIGVVGGIVDLPYHALIRLYDSPDPRIKSIEVNRPVATSQLTVSTANGPGGLNVQSIWINNNMRGQNQWIAILDIGTERYHPFFEGKYIGEACFGTNSFDYVSVCPGAPPSGEVIGVIGAAYPCGAPTAFPPPTFLWNSLCRHGTFVAGTAAGQSGDIFRNLNGVANDADLFLINVFSKHRTKIEPTTGEPLYQVQAFDLVRALQTLATLPPTFPEITANVSIGGAPGFTSDCSLSGMTAVVAQLKTLRIPVVAASGNQGYRTQVSFPACSPQVIKVAASDKVTGALWPGSNTYNPSVSPFSGPLFAAPGTNIYTSTTGGTYANEGSGTSLAAPHVSGLYAIMKAVFPYIAVDDMTAYFMGQASVMMNVPTTAPQIPYQIHRVRLPYY